MKVELSRFPYLAGRARQKLTNHLRSVAEVHADERHVLRQLLDATRLWLGGNRVGMGEYMAQGMYSRRIYPNNGLASYGGWWLKESIHAQLNNIRWEGMVTDKLMLYALFDQFGLPHPKVRAAGWRRARTCGDIPVFRKAEDVADFLRGSTELYPLFCKPVKGSYGRGAARIEGYDAQNDALLLSDGSRPGVMPFLHSLEDDGWGILIQDAVNPPEATRPICGKAVSGCRVIMLLDDDGAHPYKVVWKVPALLNCSDNFHNGSTGNTIASVDIDSGRVMRAVTGKGSKLHLVDRHPQTEYPLVGEQVPQWEAMMALLTRAAESFPGFRWQHWDVGISDKGPTLYELNSAGHVTATQIAYGQGIKDEQIKDFLRKHGKREPAPGKVF